MKKISTKAIDKLAILSLGAMLCFGLAAMTECMHPITNYWRVLAWFSIATIMMITFWLMTILKRYTIKYNKAVYKE